MSTVYIGIGSNLGDRQQNIERALEKLKTRKGIELREISSVIETEPEDNKEDPKFLNSCCRIETTLYPDELLSTLKSIEREMGRGRSFLKKQMSAQEQLDAFEKGFDIESINRDTGPVKDQEPEKKGAPRIIDLDILFYDDIIMKGNNLVIPHQLLHKRLFVIEPLVKIAPELIHPVLNKSIKDILSEIKVEDRSSGSEQVEQAPEVFGEKQNLNDQPLAGSHEQASEVLSIQHREPDKHFTLLEIIKKILHIPGHKDTEADIKDASD